MREGANSSLHRFAGLSAGAAFLLIAAGGMVTSTGSGLAVPDWPLSYGRAMPPMVGGILFEHGHRMLAGLVGLLTWALAAWVWIAEPRRWIRLLAAFAAGGIVAQAVLGGVTVLYGLPHWVSALHGCLGQALFCALLLLWDATGTAVRGRSEAGARWRTGALAFGALFLQLGFGAFYRHAGSGFVLHLAGAALATVAVILLLRLALAEEGDPSLSAPAYWLMGLFPLQLALGAAALALRGRRFSPQIAAAAGLRGMPAGIFPAGYLLPSAVTAMHVACGAALLGATAVWTLRSLRESGRLAR